ncbi:cell wall-binding protein [Clostridium beijerinckii]|nr:cell wall-binding protein [Clostridium beijerinckii]
MNKNIKRIVALALAVGTVSAVIPVSNINLLTTRAYAAVQENDEDYIDSLKIYDEDGNKLNLYKNTDYKTIIDADEVDDRITYYVKSPTDTVNIKIEGPEKKYVKIFNGTSSSTKGQNPSEDIKVSSDGAYKSIAIKVYGQEPADDIKYSDSYNYDVLSTYKIKVEYTGTSQDNDLYLKRLSIDGIMIGLSDDKEEYTYGVDSDVKEVIIRATPEDEDYDVTIDGELVHSADNFKQKVKLDKGLNEFPIKLKDSDLEKTYTVFINRGSAVSTNSNSNSTTNPADNSAIYLEKLSIDGKIQSLSESKTNYIYNVDEDTNNITVKATPENNNYDVLVNGEYVDNDGDYKKKINLSKGVNQISIVVEENFKKRVYNLTVNRGSVTLNSTSNNETTISGNQWVQVQGKWKYIDSSKNPEKNIWVGNYYISDDEYMALGWLNYNESWYYLGFDGAKKTGWQKVDGIWYHLDSEGRVQTGWFKDVDGEYYYLNSFGAMVYSTIIDGYALDSNGVWTGR